MQAVQAPGSHRSSRARPAARARLEAHHVPLLAGMYLALVAVAVLAVDVAGWPDARELLAVLSGQPILWFAVFNEMGPTEVFQWGLLIATAVTAARLSGRLDRLEDNDARVFWVLIAVTAAVLALEDAATLRHKVSRLTMGLFGVEGRHPLRTGTELAYYAAIASIPVYALVRYRKVAWRGPGRRHLTAAVALYLTAAVASASRDLGGWYVRLGTGIDDLTGGRLGSGFVQTVPDRPVGFYVVDFLLEESLELMASAFLLAAVVAWSAGQRQAGPEDPSGSGGSGPGEAPGGTATVMHDDPLPRDR